MWRLNVIPTQVQRLLHIGSLTIIWFSTHLHTELRISSIPCTNLILGCILKIYKLKILAHTNVSRKIRLEKRREASCYTVSILSIILNSYGKISYNPLKIIAIEHNWSTYIVFQNSKKQQKHPHGTLRTIILLVRVVCKYKLLRKYKNYKMSN